MNLLEPLHTKCGVGKFFALTSIYMHYDHYEISYILRQEHKTVRKVGSRIIAEIVLLFFTNLAQN